jgi:heme exporter protein A
MMAPFQRGSYESDAMIQVENLSVAYADTPLFASVCFELPHTSWLHVQGANGAGKSTLLKVLVGLMRPQSGHVTWNGLKIESCLSEYQQQLVYVGHQNGLSEALTVHENLQLDWQYHSGAKPSLVRGLEAFKLLDVQKKVVANLSKGQQRKVALLRLWLTQAQLWVLDEPFTALDEESRQVLLDKFQQHLEAGGQLIVTSHQALSLPKLTRIELNL